MAARFDKKMSFDHSEYADESDDEKDVWDKSFQEEDDEGIDIADNFLSDIDEDVDDDSL